MKKTNLQMNNYRMLIVFVFSILYNIKGFNQRASGTLAFNEGTAGWSKINWEVSYNIALGPGEGKGNINFNSPICKTTIANDARYIYEGKSYSPSDLGLSSWPTESQSDYFSIDISFYYKGQLVKSVEGWQLVSYPELLGTFRGKDLKLDNTFNAIVGKTSIPYVGFRASDFTATLKNPRIMGSHMASSKIIALIRKKQEAANAAKTLPTSSNVIIGSPSNNNTSSSNKTSATSTSQTASSSYYSNQKKSTSSSTAGTVKQPTWQETNARIKAENQRKYAEQQARYAQQQQANKVASEKFVSDATELAGMVGNMLRQNREEKEKKELRKQQQELREREERQAEQERLNEIARKKAQELQLRNSFFAEFPDGGVPLSSQKIPVTELFYFTYVFDKSTIASTYPKLMLSNVFTVSQYADGTWPFKANIVADIKKLAPTGTITLIGYFTTKELAEETRNNAMSIAGQSGLDVTDIAYKGKKNDGTSTKDFWGNENKNKTDSLGKAKLRIAKGDEDFWETGQTKKKEAEDKKKEDDKKKAAKKEDFWNN